MNETVGRNPWMRMALALAMACVSALSTLGAESSAKAVPEARLESLAPDRALPAGLVPVPFDKVASPVALFDPAGALGKAAALSPGAWAGGLAALDGIPFLLGTNGVDAAASCAGLREPFREPPGDRPRLVVPADQYCALHVLAFSRRLPGTVPRMTVRVGGDVLSNVSVAVPDLQDAAGGAGARSSLPVKLADGSQGYLHHLRVPLDVSGNYWEMSRGKSKTMNLEFTRDVVVHISHPEPAFFHEMPAGEPSSVVVVAATLERSPVEAAYWTDSPVAIFEEAQQALWRVSVSNRFDQPVSGEVRLRCAGPGTGEQALAGRAEWVVSAPFALKPAERRELALDVKPKSGARGWYGGVFEVWVGGERAQVRDTSFAILAPEARQAGDASPFGVFVYGGNQYGAYFRDAAEAVEKQAYVARKGGWRWMRGKDGPPYTLKSTARIPPPVADAATPAALKEGVARGDDPFYLINAEGCGVNRIGFRLHEILGGPAYAIEPQEQWNLRLCREGWSRAAEAYKKLGTGAKFIVGDSPSVAVEFMKDGLGKEVDVYGVRGLAHFWREPERQPDWHGLLASLQQVSRAKAKYGYPDLEVWATQGLQHGTAPGDLTPHRQAVIYVRESMLALANGVSRIVDMGSLRDCTSGLNGRNLGSIGFCGRDPEMAPKPSFAMYAWLTQALDGAAFSGFLNAPDTSIHVLDFVRKDGGHVYPVWVVRGRQTVSLAVAGASPVVYDAYGNRMAAAVKDGVLAVEATDAPLYVTGATVSSVAAAAPVEIAGPSGTLIVDFDDAGRFKPVEGKSAVLEGNWEYPRVRGTFKTEAVVEDGATALRVELQKDSHPSGLVQRYVELALSAPIELQGRPAAFAVRVKGNGGWGKIMFELVDAKGRIWTSSGNQYSGAVNSSDCKGDAFVSFAGWQTMLIPLPGQHPGADQHVAWPSLCDWWPENTPEWAETQKRPEWIEAQRKYEAYRAEYPAILKAWQEKNPTDTHIPRPPSNPGGYTGLARVDYPVKLTKVIVAMPPSVLYVNTEVPVEKLALFLDKIEVISTLP